MKSFTIAALLAAIASAYGGGMDDECTMAAADANASYKGQAAAWGAEAAANAVKVNAVTGDFSVTGKTAINLAPPTAAVKPAATPTTFSYAGLLAAAAKAAAATAPSAPKPEPNVAPAPLEPAAEAKSYYKPASAAANYLKKAAETSAPRFQADNSWGDFDNYKSSERQVAKAYSAGLPKEHEESKASVVQERYLNDRDKLANQVGFKYWDDGLTRGTNTFKVDVGSAFGNQSGFDGYGAGFDNGFDEPYSRRATSGSAASQSSKGASISASSAPKASVASGSNGGSGVSGGLKQTSSRPENEQLNFQGGFQGATTTVRGDLNNAGKYYSRDIPNYAKNASQGIGNIGSAGPIGARDFGYQGQLKPNFTEAQTYDYGNYGDYTKSFKFGAESRPYTDSFKPEGPASFKDVNIGEQGVGQYGYKGQVGDYGKATFGDYDLGSYGGYGVKGENYSASIGKASHGVGQVGFSGDDYSFDGRVGGFGKVGGDYNIGAYGMTGNQFGLNGVHGLNGLNGLSGVNNNLEGIEGLGGVSHLTGLKGLNGVNNNLGNINSLKGVQGINGLNGVNNNLQGIKSLQGVQSLNGINGLKGVNNNLQNLQGLNGVEGLNGVKGLNGLNNKLGINGLNGVQGLNGLSGLNGIRGEDFGTQGSSYDVGSYGGKVGYSSGKVGSGSKLDYGQEYADYNYGYGSKGGYGANSRSYGGYGPANYGSSYSSRGPAGYGRPSYGNYW